MTSIGARTPRAHWVRAIGMGFLAEVSTVLTIILIVETYRVALGNGISDADYAAFGIRTGWIVGLVGGTLFTFLFARVLMMLLDSRFVAHGVVVALSATAFSVAGSIAGHNSVPSFYVLASILKLVAGALAGVLAAKRVAPAPA